MIKRFFSKSEDPWFLWIIGGLSLGGIIILSSASVGLSQEKYGFVGFIAFRQMLAMLFGILGFIALQFVPHRVWKAIAPFAFLGAMVLLAMVFVPGIGLELQGAKRWINLGFATIQPSEIAKPVLVMFLAWWISRSGPRIATFTYGLAPFLGIMGLVAALLVLEPDLGTFGIMAITALMLFYAGGGRLSHTILVIIIGVLAVLALAYAAPYRMERLTVFLHPESDPQGIGYQIRQAAIAIGSGGFWGLGYGESRQKFNYLPEPIGDSVFAVFSEEFGFFGSLVVIALFLMLLWRGLAIARKAQDNFSRLLGSGIILTIVIQAFVNIGSISGLLPLTGIPLPFISYGGTSLTVMLSSLGIVYRIAKT